MPSTVTVLTDTTAPADLGRRLTTLLPDARIVRCRPWDLLAQAPAAEVLVVDRAAIDSAVLRVAPRLRLVHLLGSTVDQVDLGACRRQGVYVANVPWGSAVRGTNEARLVEAGRPAADLAASTLARIVASNIRRLLRDQAPIFWINPPAWLDADQALCGRAVPSRLAARVS